MNNIYVSNGNAETLLILQMISFYIRELDLYLTNHYSK